MIQAAAETFSIHAKVGSEGRTQLGNKASKIFGPLKNTLTLLRDGDLKVVLLTSHFLTHYYPVSNLLRNRVSQALGIPREQVLCFSSHNHCAVKLNNHQYHIGKVMPDYAVPEEELTWEGRELLNGYLAAAQRANSRLVDVTVRYGAGHERRITHNRKGRRADGTTYLMREEDRLRLGEDFCGDIDDDAFVVGFFDTQGRPVAMLGHFTGHPVTAFHCDHPIVHGEFPQVACDDLSAAYGGIPVAFLQGCAGDTNAKGLLSLLTPEENVQRAEKYGHQLGETFQTIARTLQPSKRNDLRLLWRTVTLPFRGVPPVADLEARLAKAEDFLQRCDQGDEPGTRGCDGLNFPSNMSLPYRRKLIEPIRDWLAWCLSFHRENRLHEAPLSASLRTVVLRVGDVGIAAMPCEPLLGIGRQIKRSSPTPLTLPCGYMNDTSLGYVPDSPNCEELDYVSGFYRYTTTLLPFQKPAGNLLASAAVADLAASLK